MGIYMRNIQVHHNENKHNYHLVTDPGNMLS